MDKAEFTFNIKLILAYEGTAYKGWQKTAMGPSIEEQLEIALLQILRHPVKLQAASRTDKGVHALGQTVNFFTPRSLDLKKLQRGLNALLPKDIVVLETIEESPNFHPTLDVLAKEYFYEICYSPVQLPQKRLFSWHFPYSLEIEMMKKAALYLIGTHDFQSFCNQKKNEKYQNHQRLIETIDFYLIEPKRLQIKIKGPNFLYNMVRIIVGTLVYIGCGKIKGTEIERILNSKDRKLAGVTAPAHGLTLNKIFY